MCGIFCAVSCQNKQIASCLEKLLQNRGPNASSSLYIDNVLFSGHVLWQQGNKPCVQPLQNEKLVLLFNGDIFNMTSADTSISDTEWLFKRLTKCENGTDICNILRSIEGPYSFICYYGKNKTLYFGRDSLGRNSLIMQTNAAGVLQISSSSYNCDEIDNCIEVPAAGLFSMQIDDRTLYDSTMTLYPWTAKHNEMYLLELQTLACNVSIKDEIAPNWLTIPNDEMYAFNFYEMSLPQQTAEEVFDHLLSQSDFVHALNHFAELLSHSVQLRVQTTTALCSQCLADKMAVEETCAHAKVAILFSGGIDCSILAALCDKFVPESDAIDLINVAFESVNGSKSWQVPDRITAKQALHDLQALCPTRNWNFIEVNVPRRELQDMLQSHIKHLIYPLCTVLDESLGSAFWFAARGKGENYSTTARVVIVGSGADELFGGYMRHRNAYKRCSSTDEHSKQQQVQKELDLDWQRIPTRNLARDDRVIADNGKTSRAPFIEENVVRFVRALKPWQRSCYTLNEGIGDKLFLRAYGYSLGLQSSCGFKKRAIQFGSKIADKNQKASDNSAFLKIHSSNSRLK